MEGDPVKTTITLSREFGCEGYPLATMLKNRLDETTDQTWTIFDNQFVDQLVSDSDIARHLQKNLGSRSRYLDAIIGSLLPTWKSENAAFKPMVEAIFTVAQQGNAIILERGAFAITRKLPNCFHFRLIAPLEYRSESYARRTGKSMEESRQIVIEKEKVRTHYLAEFLDCDFDQHNFHMIFNNSKLPIEKIAKAILDLIEV